jgi:hypothetical protein
MKPLKTLANLTEYANECNWRLKFIGDDGIYHFIAPSGNNVQFEVKNDKVRYSKYLD